MKKIVMCLLFIFIFIIGCGGNSIERFQFLKCDVDKNDEIYMIDNEQWRFIIIKENGDVYYYEFDSLLTTDPWLKIKRKLYNSTTPIVDFIINNDNNEAFRVNIKLGNGKYRDCKKLAD